MRWFKELIDDAGVIVKGFVLIACLSFGIALIDWLGLTPLIVGCVLIACTTWLLNK
jgi:hypothetical protein